MERLVTLILVSRMARCWYTHTRPCLDTGGTLDHFQPLSFPSLSLCLSSFLPRPSRCHPLVPVSFLPFPPRFIYPPILFLFAHRAGSRTHAEFNPLCDDERTPLESFDIGDVGKYTGGRIYRIFFSMHTEAGRARQRARRRVSTATGVRCRSELLPRLKRTSTGPSTGSRSSVMKICPVDEAREFRQGSRRRKKNVLTHGIRVCIRTF